jgi:TPR repeat protein
MMCEHGIGVEKDHVSAWMWYSLAAAQGHRAATERRTILEKCMTVDQIRESKERAVQWVEQHRG